MQLLIIARDKLALLVLSTDIPRVLAVSQRQHILYQFIDRVLNGAQAGALVLDKLALLVLSTNRFQYIPFQYIPRVLAVLVGVRSGATFDEQISIHPISIHPTSSSRARWRPPAPA